MKKFLAGFLSLALVVAVCFSFAACGKKGDKQLEGKTFVLSNVNYHVLQTTFTKNDDGEYDEAYSISTYTIKEMIKQNYLAQNNVTEDELTEEQKTQIETLYTDWLENQELSLDTKEFTLKTQIRFEDGKAYLEKVSTYKFLDGRTETITEAKVFDYERNDDNGRVNLKAVVDGQETVYKNTIIDESKSNNLIVIEDGSFLNEYIGISNLSGGSFQAWFAKNNQYEFGADTYQQFGYNSYSVEFKLV